jgi:predicted  nucleic acid-binding Zn-ribbon protein
MQNVRCLECGQPYAKPIHGSITVTNPGCPRCGYVGWVPVTEQAPVRSGAGRPLRPLR